ncbi:MAG TPA: hypothetical protein VNI54_04575 [Thermoanaerobaculia bacterium]|nr:hypothetical protein [Thermoanaerobaculia bacterium]
MGKIVEIAEDELAQRARASGMTIPELVAHELGMVVPKRPLDEILDEVLREPVVYLGSSTADIIRELRGPLPEDDADRR